MNNLPVSRARKLRRLRLGAAAIALALAQPVAAKWVFDPAAPETDGFGQELYLECHFAVPGGGEIEVPANAALKARSNIDIVARVGGEVYRGRGRLLVGSAVTPHLNPVQVYIGF